MFDTKHFELPDGRRLAFRHIRGNGPALVFLPGYMSDMAGGKATALFDWARKQGRTCLLLDLHTVIEVLLSKSASVLACAREHRRAPPVSGHCQCLRTLSGHSVSEHDTGPAF